MTNWDKATVVDVIASAGLEGANKPIVAHWLSQWRNGNAPAIAGFDTGPIVAHAPGIAIFEIRQNESLKCLKAGAFYRLAVGFDMEGEMS